MKKFVSIVCLFLFTISGIMAKGNVVPLYEITGAGSGTEGTVLVKVYVYEKGASDADLIRAAVHGVVFRGVSSGNMSGANQPAMATPSAEKDNATFCESFFDTNGECQNYASIVSGSYDRARTTKGYKVGAILQVNKKELRKVLEKAGVVRALSSGF